MKNLNIDELALFISEYLQALQASGAYVSRVQKCTSRIANAYGYDININFFFNNTALMLASKSDPHIKETLVLSNPPVNINLASLRELSALSWDIYDSVPDLSICYENLKEAKERTSTPQPLFMLFLIIGISFGALCKLFGGDFISMLLVFGATSSGAFLRHILSLKSIDIRLQYIFLSFYSSAFVAFVGGFASKFFGDFTLHIALATSTLYMIPGVFFINSIIDILDNHILVGFSRIVNIIILITCMALGMYLTLFIFDVGGLK